MTIPTTIRIPFMAVEFDAARANQGPGALLYDAWIIGQRTAAAAAAPGAPAANTIHRVTSVNEVIDLGGRGSMLHRQAIAWFASNQQTPLYIGILDDDGGGAAAAGSITVTGPATADGTIALYYGGVRRAVRVTSGNSADDIAAAIKADLDLALDQPVTGTVLTNVVTTNFVHKGEVGNAYDIRHSFNDGESLPAGVGLTIVQTTGGTSNPSLTALIAAMGDQWFQVIAHPYTDATSLTAIENELKSRDGYERMIDGVAFTSAVGSVGTLAALGNTRNGEFSVILSQPGQNPLTPPMEFAAEVAAVVAISGQAQPNLPLHRIPLINAIAPDDADLFTNTERNSLLYDGIATSKTVGGRVQTEGIITTYRLNASGAPDTAYLRVETRLTLLYLRWSWRNWIEQRYPRSLIAEDGVVVAAGIQVMTPSIAETESIAWFGAMAELALVQNLDAFKAALTTGIDPVDGNRMNWYLPPNLIRQLIVGATTIAFR